jgi:competence protein ComEC
MALIAVGCLLLATGLMMHRRAPGDVFTGICLSLLLLLLGYANHDIRIQKIHDIRNFEASSGSMALYLPRAPVIRDNQVQTVGRIVSVGKPENKPLINQQLLIYLERNEASVQLAAGNVVLAFTRPVNVPEPLNPGEFNWCAFMAGRNIHKQAYLESSQWRISDTPCGPSLTTKADRCLQFLLAIYKRLALKQNLNGLLSALTLGYKGEVDAFTRQAFSRAGVMHVMALSGFNVAVIAYTLGFLLPWLKRFKSGAMYLATITISIVWIFAFVTGLSPSVCRAAAMISLLLLGKAFNRNVNTYNILFASATLMLALSPALITDVGFQLSFTAVWGILLFQKRFLSLVTFRNPGLRWLWNLFAVSFAAQLATTPLTLYYFHQFPVYFWLSNLFVVPLVSVIIVVAAFYLILASLSIPAMWAGKILECLLSALFHSVSWIEALPCAVIENVFLTASQSALLLATVSIFGIMLVLKRKSLLMLLLFLLLIFQLSDVCRLNKLHQQKIFMVPVLDRSSALVFVDYPNSMGVGDSLLASGSSRFSQRLNNFWLGCGIQKPRWLNYDISEAFYNSSFVPTAAIRGNLVFFFASDRILVARNDSLYAGETLSKWPTDILVITGRCHLPPQTVCSAIRPARVIIDASVSYKSTQNWLSWCAKNHVPCWNTIKQGAFVNIYRK